MSLLQIYFAGPDEQLGYITRFPIRTGFDQFRTGSLRACWGKHSSLPLIFPITRAGVTRAVGQPDQIGSHGLSNNSLALISDSKECEQRARNRGFPQFQTRGPPPITRTPFFLARTWPKLCLELFSLMKGSSTGMMGWWVQ